MLGHSQASVISEFVIEHLMRGTHSVMKKKGANFSLYLLCNLRHTPRMCL